ncbi:MAG TPA: hypothetical protein VFL91_00860 [Thermomicrobiales bacterium]|nr:hypothetical protein [Thermomicrobiales bacterium]
MTGTKARATLERLRGLAAAPDEQVAYALRLLDRERNVEVLRAALDLLAARADPALRPAFLRRYAHHDQDGTRRDPGGTLRIAFLHALRPLARPEDAALCERAATTYEFLYGEATGDLRGAGLLVLNEVDDALAGYHAVRLLADRYTSPLSGEPALTAVRVLAAQGQLLPLYAYVTGAEQGVGDVVAESLRSLTAVPASLLPALVERYRESEDEIVLLGLFDLLLAHAARDEYMAFVLDFLRATALLNIYRYLVSVLVAGREASLIAALETMAEEEPNRDKAAILRDALALR